VLASQDTVAAAGTHDVDPLDRDACSREQRVGQLPGPPAQGEHRAVMIRI